ncbi:guanylate kinase [Paenibacillus campi]|uniref:guanylate kinase n=1 Tax=Paenibacillus campi TaxID=3106031 RepID=UPI002AFEC587|nr:guanylate kinase [Paenibacillus sp. SGZ-1009]
MSFSIVIFQGPSASGKSTLQSRLGLPRIVTWTSRAPRAGEQDGREYHFATREQIELMHRQGLMLEINEYRGNLYGTSIGSLEQAGQDGQPRSSVMEAQGARLVKQLLGERALLIGVSASREQLERRLFERKVSIQEQQLRMASFDEEIAALAQCDIVIRNDANQFCVSESIIDYIRAGLAREGKSYG